MADIVKAAKLSVLMAAAALAGCSMAPEYRAPEMAVPTAYKEVAGWAPATPVDDAPRGAWWAPFGDPVLDDLEKRAEAASPTLAAAFARYEQARAVARVNGSELFPSVIAGGSASRERVSGNRPLANGTAETYSNFEIDAALDYELDLWGRVRNSVKAGRADAEASAGDLASARLSLQAAVADAYFRLRGLDTEAELLRQTVDAFERAYELTAKRHDGGIASGIDVNRARTVLAEARAQISAIANRRVATEHELAALVGEVASGFSVAPFAKPPAAPAMAAGLPSVLLQRRPDIAAAERRMYAANARIGVAKAAFFPTLTLGLDAGYQTTHGALLEAPNSFWGLGPLSAVVSLFDGGRRKAQVALSRAEYDELAAGYRATVLTAFREVEDALAALRYLGTQLADQREAAEAAARTRDLALTRYRDGASDYLEVVVAQTAALDAERAVLTLETGRAQAAVALAKAIGGAHDS